MPALDDLLPFYDALGDDDAALLRRALADDPALAEQLARWRRLRRALGQRLGAAVPDRELLVRYALQERPDVLTPEERQALDEARHVLDQALAEHPALADVVRRIQSDAEAFDAAWAGARTPTTPAPRAAARDRAPERRPARSRRWWRVPVLGAVAAFAVLVALLVQRDANQIVAQTGPGEIRQITLADGTSVRLLEASRLTFADPERTTVFDRRVRLEGRAFFDVARDPAHPFAVVTATAVATVLGTSFGVTAGEATTEVVLATGRVALAPQGAPGSQVVLEPGQRSRVVAGAPPTPPEPVELGEALAWTGFFVFRATAAATAAAQLARHFDVPVELDPALAAEAITGRFDRSEAPQSILERIAVPMGAEVVALAEGGYRIQPAR